MKALRFLPLLAVPALLALYTPGADLRFAPEAETEIELAFTNNLEFFLDDFQAEAMGQDIGAMLGDVEVNVTVDIEAEFTDTYVDSSDRRPVALRRTYGAATISGEFTGSGGGESQSESFEVEGGLEDVTVHFDWDEDANDYVASYPEDEEGDEDLLAGLEARLDLGFLLPEEDVSEGDEWEVDPLKLGALLLPGGDLAYDTEAGDRPSADGAMDEEAIEEALAGLLEGEVMATFKGMREGDLAEISISLDIAGDQDFADKIADAIAAAAEMGGQEIDPDDMPNIDTFALSVTWEGEGTLLWDMAAGHLSSFEMSSEMELSLAVEMSVAQEDMEIPITGEVIMGGTAEIKIES